ncbi:FecR domain-containing protein [Mycoplana ramosa]|uniref:FecR domain-containing protein n=1 Tax=Mycoplana ramosa TaxID=40837 RepID=A0ABW3Z191_MYCRA
MQERDRWGGLPVGRREFVAGSLLALASIPSRTAAANAVIGAADEVRGMVSRKIGGTNAPIRAGADIMDRDFIITGEQSFAALTLGSDTKLLLGSQTQLLVDSFIAGQGGTIELGTGRMIFDRPEGAPKLDLALRTAFGMIGVRGTKFFAGPNRGAFAVFVERGAVDVTGGGVTRRVGAGEGIDIAAPGAAPGPVRRWGEARIREAYESVGVR